MERTEIERLLHCMGGHNSTARYELIETHISWLLLGGKLAYKVKRPVALSFLDFSTLELRRYFCERELHLNRRFAPDVYRAVRTVYRTPAGFAIGKAPSAKLIADYALEMKRLDGNRLMSRMLEHNQVGESGIQALAGVVAQFHQQAEVVHGRNNLPKLDAAFADVRNERYTIAALLGGAEAAIVDAAVDASRKFLQYYAATLRDREHMGLVRDCHGDLHTNNIFLYTEPVLFDCIEFNDTYRHIDILSEVAFLMMDLEARGYPELAQMFLSHYRRQASDLCRPEDDVLLDWFLCYRANVRSKVAALSAAGTQDKALRERYTRHLRTYINLMQKYMRRMKPGP